MEDRYQKYQNKAFSSEQWHVLKKAIDEDVDVAGIANEKFNPEQMQLLINARRQNIDISVILDPSLTEEQMVRFIEHIADEMGVFDEHYEKIRRKWLKNITWLTVLVILIISIGLSVFLTKDEWMKYFQELYLKFTVDVVVLEAGEPFVPATYIKAYDPHASITLPEVDNVNTKKPGSFWVTYKISNGRKSESLKLLITVKDSKAPVISLSKHDIKVETGHDVNAKDFLQSAKDNVDGDITDKVKITFSKNGDKILYTVKDSSSNEASEALNITYYEKPALPEENKTVKQKQNPSIPKEAPKENDPVKDDIPSSVPVTANDRTFPFEEGKPFDTTYQECMNYGNSVVMSGKANKATCSIYNDDNGIHKGYTINFN